MMDNNKNILIVDDEPKIVEVVSALFENKGFTVFKAENGRQALDIFNVENILIVLLDLMLPDISGEEVCRLIRQSSRIPIIMLTAKTDEGNVVSGLNLGADDYITKPFRLKELLARVEAVLRRSGDDLSPLTKKSIWRDGNLIIDFENNDVRKKGIVITFTPNEFKILSVLVKYPGKTFTREKLIALAMDEDFDGYDRTIDSHIKNIRKKIEDDPKKPTYLLTVSGFGYKFEGTK